MSRCFPFPPPGYEKKARNDDTDLLKKEKDKERKHKKEKKDKEKREDKGKREKDRSDGKPRDKKERKEKHRDKKKDKEERNKDKDKSSTSEEKKIAGQLESYSGEKLNQRERERDKDKSNISNEKKLGHSGEKAIRESLLPDGAGDSKFVQELGRRIRDEEKGIGSQLVEKLPGAKQKYDERFDRVVVKDTGILAEGKEKYKEKRVDNRKINGQGIGGDTKSSGSALVQNFTGIVPNRVEGMPRPLEKNIERRMEEKEKSKEVVGDEKPGDKRKVKDREKKSHGKDKEREKEKKKEEKVKEKIEHKNKDGDKLENRNKNDLFGTQNIRTAHVTNDDDSIDRKTATEVNTKKRKDFEANGFLHDADIRPNKMLRPIPHPSTANGRKLEPCQTATMFPSDGQGPPNNLKIENRERKVNGVIEARSLSISSKKSSAITQADQIAKAHRVNGVIEAQSSSISKKSLSAITQADQIAQAPMVNGVTEAQSSSISSKKSSSAAAQADQIAQASMKPPHPDSKYLSQVLSVPKMEEWSEFDDQEWLFSGKTHLSEKPDLGSAGVSEMPRVWAEALQIESVDVCALPYVIPY